MKMVELGSMHVQIRNVGDMLLRSQLEVKPHTKVTCQFNLLDGVGTDVE